MTCVGSGHNCEKFQDILTRRSTCTYTESNDYSTARESGQLAIDPKTTVKRAAASGKWEVKRTDWLHLGSEMDSTLVSQCQILKEMSRSRFTYDQLK
jgi:hypothetical protein